MMVDSQEIGAKGDGEGDGLAHVRDAHDATGDQKRAGPEDDPAIFSRRFEHERRFRRQAGFSQAFERGPDTRGGRTQGFGANL